MGLRPWPWPWPCGRHIFDISMAKPPEPRLTAVLLSVNLFRTREADTGDPLHTRIGGARPIGHIGGAEDDTALQTSRQFEEFYRSHAPGLLRYASAVAGRGRRAEAEDACQEAWLKMWRAWDSADPARRDAWALRIVRNCCIDAKRREQRLGSGAVLHLADSAHEPRSTTAEPEEVAVGAAEGSVVTEAIEALPDHLRQTLWLREVMDLSYAEIAASLGIPAGTVMSRLHAARRRLARSLGRLQP